MPTRAGRFRCRRRRRRVRSRRRTDRWPGRWRSWRDGRGVRLAVVSPQPAGPVVTESARERQGAVDEPRILLAPERRQLEVRLLSCLFDALTRVVQLDHGSTGHSQVAGEANLLVPGGELFLALNGRGLLTPAS